MSIHFKAKFDGKVIVPVGKVDLPLNEPIVLQFEPENLSADDVTRKRSALSKLKPRRDNKVILSDDVLRRENIYEG